MNAVQVPASSRSHAEGGFGLVEAVIGLTLLAMILLLTAGLVATLPRELTRLEARREATRALSAVLESVRAGELALNNHEVDPNLFEWVQASRPAARGLRLWLRAEPTATAGLLHVTVRARYQVLHRPMERLVETRVWRP